MLNLDKTGEKAADTEPEIANAIVGTQPGVDDVETTVDDRSVIATGTTEEL